MGVFAWTAGAAISAENLPNASLTPEVIPSRRANKFLIHNQTPAYPPIARMNYIQGRVRVQTWVDDSGEVKEAHVVKGHPFLAMAALKAIQRWIFKPAHSRQGPANFLTYVDVNFSLQTRKFAAFPARPEADLSRQVLPPEFAEKPPATGNGKTVRMRILVGQDGRVMDSVPLSWSERDLTDARQVVANWTFRPARWGALAVPWYLEVDVPVDVRPTTLSDPAPADSPMPRANPR